MSDLSLVGTLSIIVVKTRPVYMEWRRVSRRFLRYGVLYAGVTVGIVAGVIQKTQALIGLFILGQILILFVFGFGDVRTADAFGTEGVMEPSDSLGDATIDRREALSLDHKLLFYGIGLAILSLAALGF
jgi:hypothetical protein